MTFDNYMQKAERALSSANLLLTSGDVEGACNRAYYAMYDRAVWVVEQATGFVGTIRQTFAQ